MGNDIVNGEVKIMSASYEERLRDDLERLLRYASTAKSVEIPAEMLSSATSALQMAKSVISEKNAQLDQETELKLFQSIDALSPRVYPVTAASLEISAVMEAGNLSTDPRHIEIRSRVVREIRKWRWAAISALALIFALNGLKAFKTEIDATQMAFITSLPDFALPITFGFLGACTFILRNILNSLADQTFVLRDRTMYNLRAILGVILGFMIPVILEKTAPAGGETSTWETGKVIVSFLAGYAVEPVFTALDNLVLTLRDAVSRGGGTAKKIG